MYRHVRAIRGVIQPAQARNGVAFFEMTPAGSSRRGIRDTKRKIPSIPSGGIPGSSVGGGIGDDAAVHHAGRYDEDEQGKLRVRVTVAQVVEQLSSEGNKPLVKGGASILPKSAFGACMIHRGVRTQCPARILLALSPSRPAGQISPGMNRKFFCGLLRKSHANLFLVGVTPPGTPAQVSRNRCPDAGKGESPDSTEGGPILLGDFRLFISDRSKST